MTTTVNFRSMLWKREKGMKVLRFSDLKCASVWCPNLTARNKEYRVMMHIGCDSKGSKSVTGVPYSSEQAACEAAFNQARVQIRAMVLAATTITAIGTGHA